MFITHTHKHAHTKPNSIHTQKQILITHIISDDELSILKYYKVYVCGRSETQRTMQKMKRLQNKHKNQIQSTKL